MNLDLSFDEKFKKGLLKLVDDFGEDLIDTPGTEEEVLEQLQSDHQVSDEEKSEALALVAALFLQGTEELNTAFQGEVETVAEEYSHDEWIIGAYSAAIAANQFHKQTVLNKFIAAVAEFKDTSSLTHIDIKIEVDKRIKEFLTQAVAEGKKVTEGKMAFWASDQTGNLVRETSKGLFKANGMEYYIWMTQGDDKVRPEHDALGETLRKWGEGLEPGEDWACRCYPVVPTKTQILKFKKTGNNKVLSAA
ncbi:hypothetical protein PM10SUCC1_32470 [Propionigenium maris DSM 9537]|uniref:Phage head morphogenesis protein, SPP1 gp7 family n=1 Tax=Propionigenium maris DSM 9537 TaxID=1123000 RepID=A0A9W6GNE0_9FUSO|nr:hypothetical protein [Propionigenium maris]GLI57733.1 hypothetical protein PM10SUCC1_32470 [Propionigenium maris DSM 9537]